MRVLEARVGERDDVICLDIVVSRRWQDEVAPQIEASNGDSDDNAGALAASGERDRITTLVRAAGLAHRFLTTVITTALSFFAPPPSTHPSPSHCPVQSRPSLRPDSLASSGKKPLLTAKHAAAWRSGIPWALRMPAGHTGGQGHSEKLRRRRPRTRPISGPVPRLPRLAS